MAPIATLVGSHTPAPDSWPAGTTGIDSSKPSKDPVPPSTSAPSAEDHKAGGKPTEVTRNGAIDGTRAQQPHSEAGVKRRAAPSPDGGGSGSGSSGCGNSGSGSGSSSGGGSPGSTNASKAARLAAGPGTAAPGGAPGRGEPQKLAYEVTEGGSKRYNICGMRFEVTGEYELTRAVGQGANGLVCSGCNLKSGKRVAIKKIPRAFEVDTDCKRLLREIKMLRHLQHANVLSLLDILPPLGRKHEWKDVYIVSELMDTDLHYVIHSKQPLSDAHTRYFLYQILSGMRSVHARNVLHRDLKPGNVLVNKNCDVKICDFGLARGIADSSQTKDLGLTEYVVTRWYRAPELLVENQTYSTAIDVWAVGCIFAEMLGRKALFPGTDYLDQLRRIIDVLGSPSDDDLAFMTNQQAVAFLRALPKRSGKKWQEIFPDISPQASELLSMMLTFNPADRCSMEDALMSRYLAPLRLGRPLPPLDTHVFDTSYEAVDGDELRERIHDEMDQMRALQPR